MKENVNTESAVSIVVRTVEEERRERRDREKIGVGTLFRGGGFLE